MRHLLVLVLLVTATAALAQPARVVGDTLELSTGEQIRMIDIDAPKGRQICQRGGHEWRCGDDAAAALEALDGARANCRRLVSSTIHRHHVVAS
jgi:endonuclease YncB( thermonuclease family)